MQRAALPPIAIVVNDTATTAAMVERTLNELGWQVHIFPHGTDALAAPMLHTAKLIVTDLHNPPMHGVAFWKALRAAGHAVPVAVISPHATELAATLVGTPGAPVAYINIPITYAALSGMLSALDLHPGAHAAAHGRQQGLQK